MVSTTLFSSRVMPPPVTDTVNAAGGAAYTRTPKAALALYAATGCLRDTYYAGAELQLAEVIALCDTLPTAFIVKTALYARREARMKDLPALLAAIVAARDGAALEPVFDRLIDNGRMLRNFVQIIRSGAVGRRSLGSRPKRLVQRWLEKASIEQLLSAAIGEKPSLADIVRMVHPKPKDAEREAFYAWLIGRPHKEEALPAMVREYEAFKRDPSGPVPALPFQYLTSLELSTAQWCEIARNASWQTIRMSLNTYARHGVLDDAETVATIAARLGDADTIAKARPFPYQLLATYKAVEKLIPPIAEALSTALEAATRKVPRLDCRVVVAVDVSNSMSSPVTGRQRGGSSSVRCLDVAALIAACLKRVNPELVVMPFNTSVRDCPMQPESPVLAQAAQLTRLHGGGTAVSAPLIRLNAQRTMLDLLVIVSDNESWRDCDKAGATQTMREWAVLKARCPNAKLACIDLVPNICAQTVIRDDLLHIGGFGDEVFDLLAQFARGDIDGGGWVERIEAMSLH